MVSLTSGCDQEQGEMGRGPSLSPFPDSLPATKMAQGNHTPPSAPTAGARPIQSSNRTWYQLIRATCLVCGFFSAAATVNLLLSSVQIFLASTPEGRVIEAKRIKGGVELHLDN